MFDKVNGRKQEWFRIVLTAAGMLFVNGLDARGIGADPVDAVPHKVASEELKIETLPVNRVLFLGNSITFHGVLESIGWKTAWGMAASEEQKDYVHVLMSKIEERAKGKPKYMVRNIADFERQLSQYDLEKELNAELGFDPDVIILAIGENVAALDSDALKQSFRESVQRLVRRCAKDRKRSVFIRSCFWATPEKDQILKEVAEEMGATFVDISALGKSESNYARAERHFEHAGVAGHPGDAGMKAIADALWLAIEAKSSAK